MSEITTFEVKFLKDNSDYGMIYEAVCPVCKERVDIAVYQLRGNKCSCGYEWSISIVATGSK